MKTENIISAICAASGAVCGSAAGKGLSFELKSGKAQKMAAGQLCEMRGVLCSAGDDRKAALEALDTAHHGSLGRCALRISWGRNLQDICAVAGGALL